MPPVCALWSLRESGARRNTAAAAAATVFLVTVLVVEVAVEALRFWLDETVALRADDSDEEIAETLVVELTDERDEGGRVEGRASLGVVVAESAPESVALGAEDKFEMTVEGVVVAVTGRRDDRMVEDGVMLLCRGRPSARAGLVEAGRRGFRQASEFLETRFAARDAA